MDLPATDFRETHRSQYVFDIYLRIHARIAVCCEQQSPFLGETEMDKSYFGPTRIRGQRGRGAAGKTIVFGADSLVNSSGPNSSTVSACALDTSNSAAIRPRKNMRRASTRSGIAPSALKVWTKSFAKARRLRATPANAFMSAVCGSIRHLLRATPSFYSVRAVERR